MRGAEPVGGGATLLVELQPARKQSVNTIQKIRIRIGDPYAAVHVGATQNDRLDPVQLCGKCASLSRKSMTPFPFWRDRLIRELKRGLELLPILRTNSRWKLDVD
jgi:hypothetical protein